VAGAKTAFVEAVRIPAEVMAPGRGGMEKEWKGEEEGRNLSQHCNGKGQRVL
jgi:hypothetical protein